MENDYYETKNLNISAYLYASGLQLVTTNNKGKEIFFVFSSKQAADELVDKYYSDKALVNPRELFARLNDLKDLIFSGN